MTNNDVLRRLRYTFDFSDQKMVDLFALGGVDADILGVLAWMKKDTEPAFLALTRRQLSAFLDGLITDKRGPRDGPAPPVVPLTNNAILRKLKIALGFQEADMLEMMALADMPLSRAELSALFRKPDHRHYKECQDQLLRNFLRGLQFKFRGKPEPEPSA